MPARQMTSSYHCQKRSTMPGKLPSCHVTYCAFNGNGISRTSCSMSRKATGTAWMECTFTFSHKSPAVAGVKKLLSSLSAWYSSRHQTIAVHITDTLMLSTVQVAYVNVARSYFHWQYQDIRPTFNRKTNCKLCIQLPRTKWIIRCKHGISISTASSHFGQLHVC